MGQNAELLGEMRQFYEHPELNYSGIKSPKDAEMRTLLSATQFYYSPYSHLIFLFIRYLFLTSHFNFGNTVLETNQSTVSGY